MVNERKLADYEKAHIDYISGMKYKDIAAKYGVKENTVKSWKRRYGWNRKNALKKVCEDASVQNSGNIEAIRSDMILQLERNGTNTKDNIDWVERYIKLCKIANELTLDIEQRGVSVQWENGKQMGVKKNDSVSELPKILKVMLDIKSKLGLVPLTNYNGGGDYEDL